jgi:hypothetical protein
MTKAIIFIIIFTLAAPVAAQAKHYGPLWAVWTHSEDPNECAAKTVFWLALAAAGICYTAKKLSSRAEVQPQEKQGRVAVEAALWMEPAGQVTPVMGIRIHW